MFEEKVQQRLSDDDEVACVLVPRSLCQAGSQQKKVCQRCVWAVE